MNKLKMLLCCNSCDPERGEVYEVSRVYAQSPPRPSPPNATKGQVLSVCQPSALCEGKVDSILDAGAFSPPFCSTKVDDHREQSLSTRLSYPDSSDFDMQDIPSYPGLNINSTNQKSVILVGQKLDCLPNQPDIDLSTKSAEQKPNACQSPSGHIFAAEISRESNQDMPSGQESKSGSDEAPKLSRPRLYSEVIANGSGASSSLDQETKN